MCTPLVNKLTFTGFSCDVSQSYSEFKMDLASRKCITTSNLIYKQYKYVWCRCTKLPLLVYITVHFQCKILKFNFCICISFICHDPSSVNQHVTGVSCCCVKHMPRDIWIAQEMTKLHRKKIWLFWCTELMLPPSSPYFWKKCK